MSELFGLLFSTALVNNLVLTYLVGLDLQVAASQRMNAAWLVGLATLYCLAICLPAIYLVDHLIIIPLSLEYLDLMFYVMLIIVIVFSSQQLMHRLLPIMYKQLDALVPVILINSILLAVILLSQEQNHSIFGMLLYGISTGIGFLFLLLILTCLRERIDNNNVPIAFRGLPILLITLGIFSMGLMGLAGLK
ncbi:MAG: electron transport complex protein RnfA [Gammaproteobacteria bacterium]|jgi:electron transport complex protein RnfA